VKTYRLPKRCGRKEIILPEGIIADNSPAKKAKTQQPLVIAFARAYRWKALLESGRFRGLSDLARAVHLDPSYVSRHLNLTLLAPDIIEMILRADEPSGLSLEWLRHAVGVGRIATANCW